MNRIKTMKRISLVALLAIIAGCTKTKFRDFERISFFQRMEFQEVTIHTNGTVIMRGYKNDGGTESLEAIARGAARGAIEGANPVP